MRYKMRIYRMEKRKIMGTDDKKEWRREAKVMGN